MTADAPVPATVPAYRARGMSDDVTTCGQCGRAELKGTVILECLDHDGNTEGLMYVGPGCAATLAKRTQREIRDEAQAADEARADARRAGQYRQSVLRTAALAAWVSETYGVKAMRRSDEPPRVPDVPGMSPYRVVKAWQAAGCPGYDDPAAEQGADREAGR